MSVKLSCSKKKKASVAVDHAFADMDRKGIWCIRIQYFQRQKSASKNFRVWFKWRSLGTKFLARTVSTSLDGWRMARAT